MKKISFVLPTLNEVSNIQNIFLSIRKIMKGIKDLSYEVIFVDDASEDGSRQVFIELAAQHEEFKFIIMSRRFGDQPAILSGLLESAGDAVVIMDADFQHPVDEIPNIIDAWRRGFDVVVMERQTSGQLSLVRQIMEILFYKTLNVLSDSKVYYRFSGFCLVSRRVVEILIKSQEVNIFFRGLVPFIGFKQIVLKYKENSRTQGISKYNFLRQLSLGVSGLTSFSVRPLWISLIMGVFISFISILYGFYILFLKISSDIGVPGWASVIVLVTFLAGLQFIVLGVIGYYIGLIYRQVQNRWRYIIDEKSQK